MRIREYTSADIDVGCAGLHAAQGFGYPLPDLDSPLFVTKLGAQKMTRMKRRFGTTRGLC